MAGHCDGDMCEFIVKLDATLTYPPTEHLFEWVAAELGRHLGVAVPESFEVVMERSFAASIPDSAVRERALGSLRPAYGSRVALGVSPPLLGEVLPAGIRLAAAELLAFDLFIHNYDRRAGSNPNVLVGRERVVPFDHGDAFGFLLPLFGAEDPIAGPLLDVARQHVFGAAVRADRSLSLARFDAAVRDLDDAFFDALRAATPTCWTTGHAVNKLDRLIDTLRQRRDSLDRWLPQVQAWMLS